MKKMIYLFAIIIGIIGSVSGATMNPAMESWREERKLIGNYIVKELPETPVAACRLFLSYMSRTEHNKESQSVWYMIIGALEKGLINDDTGEMFMIALEVMLCIKTEDERRVVLPRDTIFFPIYERAFPKTYAQWTKMRRELIPKEYL